MPVVGARIERKYIYAFSAVSPHDAVINSFLLPWVNAQVMALFSPQVAQRHAEECVLMIVDQSGWHSAGERPCCRTCAWLKLALYPATNRRPVCSLSAHSFARLKLPPSEQELKILTKIVHQAIQFNSIVYERSSFGLIGCLRKLKFATISEAFPFFDLFAYPELRLTPAFK
jgi:hypothetical protein